MSNSTDYTIGIGLETEASSTAELEKALKSLQQTIEQLNAARHTTHKMWAFAGFKPSLLFVAYLHIAVQPALH
jgi:hypothetical protein